ncbi:MAG TPA: hypothetical protein VK960_03700 [Acidimicrobiia bacterium]|nr:hypothetical protein [Acidimicrobiia bacterium]
MNRRRAYYARSGSAARDLAALLHPPYTLWHLSYVALGAGLAADIDWLRLSGTLTAFFLGLGVAAHALDEVHTRPLGTGISDGLLWALGIGGMLAAAGVAVVGAYHISPWVLAWAAAGILLAAGYALEWSRALHSDIGFALAWGSFPVVVGYWAQAEAVSPAALVAAGAAAALSLAQRRLSTPARFVRRNTKRASAVFDGEQAWDEGALLESWEGPMRALVWVVPLLAAALLLRH